MDPHSGQPLVTAGVPLGESHAVMIMVHGRNAAPRNILDLLPRLDRNGFTYLAPAAAGNTWYPYSFMADTAKNEPGLSSGLGVLERLVADPAFCIAAFTGLAIGDEESVQAFGLIWLFPLTFVSSAFVPVSSMPGWLQAFANNQPVTYVVDTMRALALGGPIEANLWKSVAWLAGIFIVFVPLAIRAYKRAA